MMKKNVFTLVFMLCCSWLASTVYGQGKLEEFMHETTPEERAQMQTDYMTETLTLNSEQVPKIHEINLKYSQKMQNAYTSGGGKLQKLKKMRGISSEKDKEVKRVLNAEQYSRYETNMEQMKEKLRARAKEKRNG